MSDDQLNDLWSEITRTARPDARVIFRTAGEASILPGRVKPDILDRWSYEAERSRILGFMDRSAIYAGFHLYRPNPPDRSWMFAIAISGTASMATSGISRRPAAKTL